MQAFEVGAREAGEHPAQEKLAAGGGLLRPHAHIVHAGLVPRARDVVDELHDGLVDRQSPGAGGKPLEGAHGLLPGGLDEAPEEPGGERLAVQYAQQVEPLGEKFGVVRGELAKFGEVARELLDALAHLFGGAQAVRAVHKEAVEIVQNESTQFGVAAAGAAGPPARAARPSSPPSPRPPRSLRRCWPTPRPSRCCRSPS